MRGEWRRQHNEKLYDLYSSNVIREIKSRIIIWAGYEARMGDGSVAYRLVVGRPEGKKSPGRPKRRRENNSKMDLKEVEWGRMNRIDLVQDTEIWRALLNLWVS